ncbi:MAG: bifunctional precorrin-2 dehydrogenase/sirohydrochlorin ferrochelatase [Chloroflexota bacterium]|nr:bifunctional precorrin-2 dehydrogenase/sirohydrochlorin ferrochelatase [Chloroflexota bacterium]
MSESRMMTGYPIMLHLQDKPVAVIGGGRVAARKVKHLRQAGARIYLISPEISPSIRGLVNVGDVVWIQSKYERDMFNEYMPILVIAATDDEEVNLRVAQDAHRIRALCNVANGSSDDSDFSNMAQIDQPPLTIALSSNNHSPALLRMLKAKLAQDIGEEYAVLADWLGALRDEAPAGNGSQPARQALYEAIVNSDVLALLRAGKRTEARHIFDKVVSEGSPK